MASAEKKNASQSRAKRRACLRRALAEVIREKREELGMSMTELGARCGLSQQSISYIEREMRSPNIETLWYISEELGMELSELIGQTEARARQLLKADEKRHS